MEKLAQVREASVKVARIQRRIWLLQTVFWPVVAIAGVVVAFVVARSVWRRSTTPPPVAPAAPQVPAGLNGAPSGN